MIAVVFLFSFADLPSCKCLDLYLESSQNEPEKHSRSTLSQCVLVPTETPRISYLISYLILIGCGCLINSI